MKSTLFGSRRTGRGPLQGQPVLHQPAAWDQLVWYSDIFEPREWSSGVDAVAFSGIRGPTVGDVDFFVNTEYIDLEQTIDLISVGVVAADGREFYAVSAEFDPSRANEFVRGVVLPLLEPRSDPAWMSRQRMRETLEAFIGNERPRFWSYGSAPWDWLTMAQLFPLADRVPDGWSYTGFDVSCLLEWAGCSPDNPDLPPPPRKRHHALADGRWARDVFRAVESRPSSIVRAVPSNDYFVDAEFIELETRIDLISLAVVAADGREFYAISTEFDPARANDFVQMVVLPQLEPPDHPSWSTRTQIKDRLLEFIGADMPRFWSWAGAPYDWMVIAQLFAPEERMPSGWSYTAYDATLLVERAGFQVEPLNNRLPPPPTNCHHALADARWLRAVAHTAMTAATQT